MHKAIVLASFVLMCTGCSGSDTVVPSPSPSPTISSIPSIDPSCLMTPAATPSPDHRPCGGSTGGISTESPIASPSAEAATTPSSTPTTTARPTFSPRPAVTTSDVECLSGHWNQGATELLFQYMQTLPTIPVLVDAGSNVDFNFVRSGNSGTFTQTFNHVVLHSSRQSVLSRGGVDDYEFTFNGTASGSFQKNDDGRIYFYDVRPEGVTLSIKVNGAEMMRDPNLTGDMLPVYATQVGVSCNNNNTLQLTYNIPSRTSTIYLDR